MEHSGLLCFRSDNCGDYFSLPSIDRYAIAFTFPTSNARWFVTEFGAKATVKDRHYIAEVLSALKKWL